MSSLHAENHVIQYKRIRGTIDTLMTVPEQERDAATIATSVHWASSHLVSAIVDQLAVPENRKHRNHRSVKQLMKHDQAVRDAIGEQVDRLHDAFVRIESRFMVKFQYGSIDKIPDYVALMGDLQEIIDICKAITTREANKNERP